MADKHIKKVQEKLEARGNRFASADDSARFFRDNFAEEGRYLQLEFGANAEPGTNAIVDIVRSPGIDAISGVGTQINIPRGIPGGASFHTHPELIHVRPGFSWGDIQAGRRSGNDSEYVFHGRPLSVGRKWNIQATSEVEDAAVYHEQNRYAPLFK